jgi:predicted oxidoreductase
VDYCRRHNIGIQAHSPFRGDVMSPPVNATSGVRRAAQAIADFAAARGTTRWVVALSWLLCHPAKIIPIFGTRDPAHITENCLADALELGREEWYRLFLSAVTGHSATPD